VAKQITFIKTPLQPREALARKLEEAPIEHAAALLNAYDVLQAAHEHGLLDVLKGAISAEDTIIEKVAGYADTPEGIRLMRNLLLVGAIVGSLDPDLLHAATKDLRASLSEEAERPQPELWATLKRMTGPDTLSGLSFAITALESLGRTVRTHGHAAKEKKAL